MMPPIACKPEQATMPPHLCRIRGSMKKTPMIKPAIVAEITESAKRMIDPKDFFSNRRLCPVEEAITSKNIEATVKPKMCTASGLNMKFIMVAINPTNVAVSSFLTHHTANTRAIDRLAVSATPVPSS